MAHSRSGSKVAITKEACLSIKSRAKCQYNRQVDGAIAIQRSAEGYKITNELYNFDPLSGDEDKPGLEDVVILQLQGTRR